MGSTCIGLSLRYRKPVVTAWSTPGAALLAAFPHELILAIAGGLATAMKDEKHRDASLVTFLVTLSGVSLFGVARPSGAWSPAPWRWRSRARARAAEGRRPHCSPRNAGWVACASTPGGAPNRLAKASALRGRWK